MASSHCNDSRLADMLPSSYISIACYHILRPRALMSCASPPQMTSRSTHGLCETGFFLTYTSTTSNTPLHTICMVTSGHRRFLHLHFSHHILLDFTFSSTSKIAALHQHLSLHCSAFRNYPGAWGPPLIVYLIWCEVCTRPLLRTASASNTDVCLRP